MILYRGILILSVIFFINKGILAQDCTELIKNYAAEISKVNSPQNSEVYYMNVDVETEYKDTGGLKKHKQNIRTYTGKDIIHYESDAISLYADAEDYIVIMHKQKMIIRSKGKINLNSNEINAEYGILYNQLIDSSRVYSCKNITENGRNLKYFVLQPNENLKKAYKTDKVKYYFDIKNKSVYKTVIYFFNSSVVKQTTVFNEINYNYTGRKLKKAKNMVFDKYDKVITKYKNYQYINNKN